MDPGQNGFADYLGGPFAGDAVGVDDHVVEQGIIEVLAEVLFQKKTARTCVRAAVPFTPERPLYTS
jgi:hypothetical protein